MNVDLGKLDVICRHKGLSYALEFEESTGLYSVLANEPFQARTSPASGFFEVKKMSSPQAAVDALVKSLEETGRGKQETTTTTEPTGPPQGEAVRLAPREDEAEEGRTRR